MDRSNPCLHHTTSFSDCNNSFRLRSRAAAKHTRSFGAKMYIYSPSRQQQAESQGGISVHGPGIRTPALLLYHEVEVNFTIPGNFPAI